MADDLMRIAKTPTMGEIAGRTSDPRFYAALSILPNPDPILRRAGKSEDVFDAVQSDAHVIGELRAIKADFLRFDHQLVVGGERRRDRRALELCQRVLDHEPAPYTRWSDVWWNIAQSTFRGLSVQEIVWDKFGEWMLPCEILDRPKRRFVFKADGELRVVTRAEPLFGIPAERLYFLVDRHIPSYDQPYGVALLSSCFWPYTFKHAGWRWFVKYCERVGVPFPKGHYPVGSDEPVKQALEDALEGLLEAGYAALEEGSDVELMESQHLGSGGKLAQAQLIELSNAEMSKALASQTLATELPKGTGSRAAAETHAGRAAGINEGDRERIAKTLNELWRLITVINLGPEAVPPTSHFLGEDAATIDRAKIYQIFADEGGRPSRKAMAKDLDIELADEADPEDAMTPAAPTQPTQLSEFSRDGDVSQSALDRAVDALDSDDQSAILAPVLKPVIEMARSEPTQFLATLGEAYPKMDQSSLIDLMTRMLFVADTWGRLMAADEADDGVTT
jgi:phage gp29-like protein